MSVRDDVRRLLQNVVVAEMRVQNIKLERLDAESDGRVDKIGGALAELRGEMRAQADSIRSEFRNEMRAGVAQIAEHLRIEQRLAALEERQRKEPPGKQ